MLADAGIRAGMAAASIALTHYMHGVTVTVDGKRLMKRPRPSPFHLRWLLPLICRDRTWAWMATAWLGLIAAVVLFPGDLWAAGLFCCLPWFRTMAQAVLVDAPAFAVSLAAMRLSGFWGGVAAFWGVGISERVPVWGALYGWRWDWLYVGLCMVLIAWKFAKSTPREGIPPFMAGHAQSMRWTSAAMLLLPWGAGLAALLSPFWTYREALIVVVAYGQMLAANDGTRLYMWAAPVVLPKAVAIIPARWMVPAIVATWFNSWATPTERGRVLV
jgi:hypothetical protein